MSAETLFLVFNFVVAPLAWALLVFLPRARITRVVVHSPFAFAVLGAMYVGALLLARPPAGAGGNDLAGVALLFSERWTALACWMHYIVMDLFVGAWIARDALRRGLPAVLRIIALLVTMFFGPLGLLGYLAARAVARREVSLADV